MVKVKEDMTGWVMSEHGVPDSRLTVIRQVEDYVSPSGIHYAQWLCECDCVKHTKLIVLGSCIKSGHTKSCGCINSERISDYNQENKRKPNIYNLNGEYGIGWTSNTNNEFYFDLEDYDKIKDYCWCEHILTNGYHALETRIHGSTTVIRMNWLIAGKDSDHEDRNPLNNRKNNLRKATFAENAQNHSRRKDNTSGISGVTFNKRMNQWQVCINIDKKRTHLGYFVNKEDAIVERLKAENKYYGEFAPQRHLFEQYGINTKQNDLKEEIDS